MEYGKNYFVVYSDGEREQGKFLNFRKVEGKFLVFFNPRSDREELIHEDRIIRMEERL